MDLWSFLILLLIAGICGALAEAVIGFSPGGFLVSIAVGLVGAYLGTWIARKFDLPGFLPISVGGQTIEVIWTILGSMILLIIISLLRGGGRRRSYRR